MPPTSPHRFGARVIAWLALAGQLALLADGAIAHVTCAVHGDLVHATAPSRALGASARPASAPTALSASLASDDALHDRCLVDEDGDVACRPAPTALLVPARVDLARVIFARREGPSARRAPLYRLAPKTSPPA